MGGKQSLACQSLLHMFCVPALGFLVEWTSGVDQMPLAAIWRRLQFYIPIECPQLRIRPERPQTREILGLSFHLTFPFL